MSSIYIKPSKRGSLRKHLGVKEGEKIPSSKLSIKPGDSAAMRKKKTFAKNARKWKHEDGGFLFDNSSDVNERILVPLQEGGEIDPKKKAVQDAYGTFLTDMDKETKIRDRARMDYYSQRLDSTLYGPDLDKMKALKSSIFGIDKRVAHADSTIKAGGFDKELTPEQMKMILGDDQFTDYVTTKERLSNLIKPEAVAGTKTPDPLIYGMRNSFATPSPKYGRTHVVNGKPLAEFEMDMRYDPTKGYTKKSAITKEYEYGGYMMPQYGFGSWLKENASGLLKGAGSLVKLIPGIGTIAGPILSMAGSAVGAVQANKQAKADAAEQQKLIDEKKAEDAKLKLASETAIRSQNLFGGDKDINYGETFAYGGGLMDQPQAQGVPQITEYSEKADLHSEGIGGVPVDVRGNPTTVSKSSAVGLTEGGEVTWNGYVFSNKLKAKK